MKAKWPTLNNPNPSDMVDPSVSDLQKLYQEKNKATCITVILEIDHRIGSIGNAH